LLAPNGGASNFGGELRILGRWPQSNVAAKRPPLFRAPNGQTVHPQDAFTRERTSGAPLAAMHQQLTLSVCKRRDAVRLAQNEPARPAGAAFGVLSGATVS